MKYNLSLNLKRFYEYAQSLDIYDAMVLDYLRDICIKQSFKNNKKIINDIFWTEIKYNHLIEEMPYLKRIKNKKYILKIIMNLKEIGFIDIDEKKKYIRILQKTDFLIFDYNEKNKEILKEKQNDNKKDDVYKKERLENINIIFNEYIMKISSNSRLTNSAKKKINTRLKEFNLDEILRSIDNFSKNEWWMTHNAKRGISWFFHTEDRMELFLNLANKEVEYKKRRGSLHDKYNLR